MLHGNVSKLVSALAREGERNAALDRYLEGVVVTSDPDDLGMLRDTCFPSVRVLGI